MSSFICKVKNIPWGGTLPWDSRWETIQRQTESWGTGSDTHPKIESGLGIRSSVFWANCLLFVSEREKERFAHEKKQIALVALLSWVTGANRSRSLFCNEWLSKERREWFTLGPKKGEKCKKMTKTYEKYVFFKQISCFLRAICLNHEQITDIALF